MSNPDVIIQLDRRLDMTKKYKFREQLAKGEAAEDELDSLFRLRGWKIAPTEMADQRRGIDRWFSVSMKPGVTSVEYKSDFRAHDTGNVYLETVSVGKYEDDEFVVKKKGWLWTTEADYLMYYIPGDRRLLLFLPKDLRNFVVENEKGLRSVSVKNQGYQGRGLLVPVARLAKIARKDWQIGVDKQLTLV